MYKSLLVMLIAFAISTPAHADIFGFFASNGGGERVLDGQAYPGQAYAPIQSHVGDGSMHGYPFYSGCCDSYSPCYDDLWSGYCGSKHGCGMKGRHCGSFKGGCGVGCGGKGGCGVEALCGGKGCDPCAPKHGRLGRFDRLHFGHGHGCDVCGGVGCSDCGGVKGGGVKGGFGKGSFMNYAPAPGFGERYYGAPTDAQDESTLQPPEVLIEPTSVSDRSAWRQPVLVNPFARPFSY